MADDNYLDKIVNYLKRDITGKTLYEIAAALDIHYQTVRGHINIGIEKGLIEKTGKRGKADIYKTPLVSMSGAAQIMWRGHYVPMSDLLSLWAADINNFPKNTYERRIAKTIINLYNASIASIDTDEPHPISFLYLKQARDEVIEIANEMKLIFTTLESLLNNEDLWRQKELVTTLLMNEGDRNTIIRLKMMVETIKEEFNKR